MLIIFLLICILTLAFMEGCKRYIWKTPTVKHENFTLVPYYRGNCSYLLHKYLEEFFDRHGFYEGTADLWKVYFPCDYSSSVQELENLDPILKKTEGKWIFLIPGDSYLAGKNYLWERLAITYGNREATKYMPNTYLLDNKLDFQRFREEYDPKKLYIMKKNTQRQKGLLIVNSLKEVEAKKDDYVVVQELLQNPLLIDGRKTNLRFYLLVTCYKGQIEAYLYRDGFMYYTSAKFVKGSTSHDINVTTGYIDREVYAKNPLTLGDLREYLNKRSMRSGDLLMERVVHLMNRIIQAVSPKLIQQRHYWNHHMFQLFGADVAISDCLEPQILELNKGPDMSAKDVRDGLLKKNLLDDVFKVIKFHPTTNVNDHDFVKVWTGLKFIKTS